jgi:hypothetical protein
LQLVGPVHDQATFGLPCAQAVTRRAQIAQQEVDALGGIGLRYCLVHGVIDSHGRLDPAARTDGGHLGSDGNLLVSHARRLTVEASGERGATVRPVGVASARILMMGFKRLIIGETEVAGPSAARDADERVVRHVVVGY